MSRSRGAKRPTPAPASSRVAAAWDLATPSRTLAVGVSIGLVALVAAIDQGVARHPFVALDDDVYLLGNPHVARGLTWEGVRWAFTHAWAANWHPLTWVVHMLDVQWFGLSPASAGAHHLVSVAFHAANAVMLFLALARLTGRQSLSAWVAAWFAVHPLRIESVAWASELKDVLSGCGFMLALLAYERYVRRPSAARMLVVLAAQIAGLLSKPMLVTLPLVLLVLDRWPLQRTARGARPLLLEKAPLFAASLGIGLAAILAQRAEGAIAPLGAIPGSARLGNALVATATYLVKTAWPANLACFYPHPATLAPSPTWPWQVAGAAALLAVATWGVVRERLRRPYLLAGWLWFLVMLAPVIGVLQVGDQAWADRYAYLPLIGIQVAVVWLVAQLVEPAPRARRLAVAGGAAALLAFAVVAARQTRVWASTDALYRHAAEVTRDNWFAENALGVEAMSQGRGQEAERHFAQSLKDLAPALRGGYREAHTNLGLLFVQERRFVDARRELMQALAADPDFAEAHNDFALLALREGRYEEARAHAARAIASRPEFADASFNLALALQAEGRLEEAAVAYARVVELQPADAEAHALLGRVWAALGRPREARAQLTEALRLAPDHPWARQTIAELDRLAR